ncbi:MAG: F0F1 ATP synthase subunit B [Bauldia sp.]|nr:F0F1 ATP synthase subunit B [Bauldia sp.]
MIAQAEGDGVPLSEELEAEAVEGVEIEHADEDTFPPFDATTFPSQLLWLAITFVAFYLLMARVVLPRIGGILEDRRDRIANDLDQASRLKQQSDDAIAGYERALAEARSGAYAIANEARDAAKAEAAAKQATIDAELNQKLAAAEKRIAEIKDRALGDVGAVAAEAAEAVVERLLGQKPSASEVSAAVTAANRREGADV